MWLTWCKWAHKHVPELLNKESVQIPDAELCIKIIIMAEQPCAKRDLCYILGIYRTYYLLFASLRVCTKVCSAHISVFTHRVPLGAALPEEYMRPDGGLWGESCTGSGILTFLMTLPEVGLACLLRAVTWHTLQTEKWGQVKTKSIPHVFLHP